MVDKGSTSNGALSPKMVVDHPLSPQVNNSFGLSTGLSGSATKKKGRDSLMSLQEQKMYEINTESPFLLSRSLDHVNEPPKRNYHSVPADFNNMDPDTVLLRREGQSAYSANDVDLVEMLANASKSSLTPTGSSDKNYGGFSPTDALRMRYDFQGGNTDAKLCAKIDDACTSTMTTYNVNNLAANTSSPTGGATSSSSNVNDKEDDAPTSETTNPSSQGNVSTMTNEQIVNATGIAPRKRSKVLQAAHSEAIPPGMENNFDFRTSPRYPTNLLSRKDGHNFNMAEQAKYESLMADSRKNRENIVRPFIIGVCGATCSGKTTLCNMLRHEFEVSDSAGANMVSPGEKKTTPSPKSAKSASRVAFVPCDSFYKALNDEQKVLAHESKFDFDHPDSIAFDELAEALRVLKRGVDKVHIPKYDFAAHDRLKETTVVMPADVIIVEGILIYAVGEELRNLMDLKIYVDCDSDVRLARRITRDTVERGRDVNGVLRQYMRFVKPSFENFVQPSKRYADVIIPNTTEDLMEKNMAVAMVMQHIKHQLEKRNSARQLSRRKF